MLNIFTVGLTILGLLTLPAEANPGTEISSPLQVIQDESQLAFTDNSSVFQFLDDGSFFMEPLGMSGRAIEGTWIYLDSNRFEITGLWGWNNGISLINDKRKMTIYLNLRSMDTVNSQSIWRSSDTRLYDVYFVIEEVTKVI